jgi:hypothetical protein
MMLHRWSMRLDMAGFAQPEDLTEPGLHHGVCQGNARPPDKLAYYNLVF